MTPDSQAIRRKILKASRASGHGHIPTSFSIVELLCAVYETMRHDPARPHWEKRDLFILSKGHASLGLYCVLSHFGYIPEEELRTFGSYRSRLGCHPDRLKVPGVEVSTGSLGHGIAVAVGMALALRLQGQGRRVYALIGDGEANEGSVWESLMVATNQKLNNLTILYDNNQSQTRSLPIPNPVQRLAAFGCDVQEVDGHDVPAIKAALACASSNTKAIVGNTIKGFPCRTLIENLYEWHRKSPDERQFEILEKELDAQAI